MTQGAMTRRAVFFFALGAAGTVPPIAGMPPSGQLGLKPLDPANYFDQLQTNSRAPAMADGIKPTDRPSEKQRILNLLRPERVSDAELAPDGHHVAYVANDNYRVQLIIIDLDRPETPKAVEIGQGSWWKQLTGSNWTPPSVTFLRWANANRLIFAEGSNGIYAVNADGRGLTKLVTGADVGFRPGQTQQDLQPAAPPGMAIAPNKLDLMAGSPPTNMDPAVRVPPGSPPSQFGTLNGQAITDSSSAHSLDEAAANSNDYIGRLDHADRTLMGSTSPKSNPSALQPRIPRVVAVPPDDPQHIIVEAAGVQIPLSGLYAYGLYRVDIETGSLVSLGETLLPGHDVLYDRSGHLRLVLGALSRSYLQVFPGSKSRWRGAIALDKAVRDPAKRGFQARPETYYGAHSVPLGFDFDPKILYYASNLARDTVGLYALDLTRGERTAFALENPNFDLVNLRAEGGVPATGGGEDPLVFDPARRELVGVRLAGPAPATQWLDSALAQIQTRLDGKFPDRNVKLLQWDDQRTRFLALVSGRSDAGRYYVYTPASEQLLLCARRAPGIFSDELSPAIALSFTGADGAPLTGSLLLPRVPRIHPAPLVVLCPDGPGQPLATGFDREAQAISGMGFMVLQVNDRSTGGWGLQRLEGIRRAIDRAPLEDILAAIDASRQHVAIDPRRIAIVGEGFGGYLALRAVQLYPQQFRCAVAVSTPVDLNQWARETDLIAKSKLRAEDKTAFQAIFDELQSNPLTPLDALHATLQPPEVPIEDSAELFAAKARLAFFDRERPNWAAVSPGHYPQEVIRPIFMVQDRTADLDLLASAQTFRHEVEKHGGQVDFLAVSGRLAEMGVKDRADVLERIEDFLNLDFYSYTVEFGDLKTRN